MTTNANKHVALRFGNGVKTHVGYQMTINGNTHVFAACGSRKSGTAKRILGDVDLKTFSTISNACEKCEVSAIEILKRMEA